MRLFLADAGPGRLLRTERPAEGSSSMWDGLGVFSGVSGLLSLLSLVRVLFLGTGVAFSLDSSFRSPAAPRGSLQAGHLLSAAPLPLFLWLKCKKQCLCVMWSHPRQWTPCGPKETILELIGKKQDIKYHDVLNKKQVEYSCVCYGNSWFNLSNVYMLLPSRRLDICTYIKDNIGTQLANLDIIMKILLQVCIKFCYAARSWNKNPRWLLQRRKIDHHESNQELSRASIYHKHILEDIYTWATYNVYEPMIATKFVNEIFHVSNLHVWNWYIESIGGWQVAIRFQSHNSFQKESKDFPLLGTVNVIYPGQEI